MIELRLRRDEELKELFELNMFGKGGKGGSVAPAPPTAAAVKADEAQIKELEDLQKKEDARTDAMKRKRRGRASLISGSETGLQTPVTGMKDTLGA